VGAATAVAAVATSEKPMLRAASLSDARRRASKPRRRTGDLRADLYEGDEYVELRCARP